MRLLTQLRESLQLRTRLLGRPQGTILMYHSIADPIVDPWELAVSSAHFAEQLEVLRQRMRPLSLRDFLKGYRTGKQPPGAVVVTFDDGYLDNLDYAYPLLKEYSMPATVFITTGYLGCERRFWWDELTWILLQSSRLPDTLTLFIGGAQHNWHLQEASIYPVEQQKRYANWTYRQAPPTMRHKLYLEVWQRLYLSSEQERQQILRQLLTWAGLTPAERSSQHPMSKIELHRLSRSELITVGAHTVTHAPLSTVSLAAQRAEIQKSKQDLEELVGTPMDLFAYPHGDFDSRTVSAIQDCGFISACTVAPGPVRRHSNPFQLPRLQMLNWNGDEFDQHLMAAGFPRKR